jgi:hypothetical protein
MAVRMIRMDAWETWRDKGRGVHVRLKSGFVSGKGTHDPLKVKTLK